MWTLKVHTMEWHHILAVFGLALAAAGMSGSTFYAVKLFEGYEDTYCNTTFYSEIQLVGEASGGLFIAGLFVLLFGTIGILHRVWEKDWIRESTIILGIVSMVCGGLLALLVSLTGVCAYPLGHAKNRSVANVKVYASFIVATGVMMAVFINIHPNWKTSVYSVASPTATTAFLWAYRFQTLIALLMITNVSGTYFQDHYKPWGTLRSNTCLQALSESNFNVCIRLFCVLCGCVLMMWLFFRRPSFDRIKKLNWRIVPLQQKRARSMEPCKAWHWP